MDQTRANYIAIVLLIGWCTYLILSAINDARQEISTSSNYLRSDISRLRYEVAQNSPEFKRRIRASQAAQETYERVMASPEAEEVTE